MAAVCVCVYAYARFVWVSVSVAEKLKLLENGTIAHADFLWSCWVGDGDHLGVLKISVPRSV